MPSLTCYRIRPPTTGESMTFEDVIESEGSGLNASSEYIGQDFVAKAFVLNPNAHSMPWAPFVNQGFPDLTIGRGSSVSALVIVNIHGKRSAPDRMFAFAFGPSGRFLLRRDCYERGYGLRTALNLVYPRGSGDGARLRAVDSKRRGETVVRSRTQSSSQADFEVFDVNRLRDVLGKAVGVPADTHWGKRVNGGDALQLDIDLSFDQLGRLCRDLDETHDRQDYQDRFGWIDDIQPVQDPAVEEILESRIVEQLKARRFDDIELAPPEIVDWDRVVAFRYHFDRRKRGGGAVLHPDLRVADYVSRLARDGDLDDLDADRLRHAYVFAVDSDESDQAKWSIWRCLVASLELDGRTYLLDEGEFFAVSRGYMAELNDAIERIPVSTLDLPATRVTTVEADYNRTAASSSQNLLLLDRKLIRLAGRATPIEVCDLLSTERQLVHVKRHLGSSDLSHLFAQGYVSAELLQSSVEFRQAVRAKIDKFAEGRSGFEFVSDESIVTSEFEVVYAIIERWRGRSFVEALPFFSKVNLREVAGNLSARGFRVSMAQVQAE
jgi:uncharacterized protein (TIGR04141 family)